MTERSLDEEGAITTVVGDRISKSDGRCCCWWPLQRFAWREDRTLVGNETEGSEDDARNVAKGLKTDPPYTSDDFGE